MKQFIYSLAIKHIKTLLYYPRVNGIVEYTNKMIKESLQIALASSKLIVQSMKHMLWSYHTTPNTVTGFSQFSLLRGRRPRSKLTPNWLFEEKSIQINKDEMKERTEKFKRNAKKDMTQNGALSYKRGKRGNGS